MARRAQSAAVALSALLAACAPTATPSTAPPSQAATASPRPAATPAATATPRASLSREEAWAEDLARIVPGFERIHPDPFRHTSREAMEAVVADLTASAATLSDDELMVGVLRLGALISTGGCDGHSGGFPWGTGTYPLDSLPLRLWLFPGDPGESNEERPPDEVVIVAALAPYEHLVGSRIDAVEGRPIDEVRETLDPVIPRDNDQTVRLLTPRYLLIPQVLRGLGLADDGPVTLDLTARDGTTTSIDVQPIPMVDYNAWAGTYGLHLPPDPDVDYLARMDAALWWELLPDGETLYVQYNQVDRTAAGLDDLREAVQAPEIDRVILDIRHNTGGEVPILDRVVPIFDHPAVDRPGELFVIVGRNTWSAGAMLTARLEALTDAVLIGETSAGCPTFYGDIVQLRLRNSGLVLLVAEMLEVGVDPNDPRLTMDIDVEAELTQADWEAGRDPAVESIVAIAP